MIKKVLVGLIMVLVVLTAFNLNIENVEAASSKTKYVTASKLNVRSGPSTTNKVISSVKKNQSVQVLQTKGTWDKIKLGSKTAWTSNKYLTTKNPVAKKPAPKKVAAKTTTMYVTASTLNVRSGASTKHKVVTTAKKNASVKVIQKKGTWSKVTVGKTTGWVSSKYLTTKKAVAKKAPVKKAVAKKAPVKKVTPAPTKVAAKTTVVKKSPAPKKVAAKTTTMYVTASTLNVRSGASTKHKVVTTVKNNASVKEIQKKGTWSKVTVGKTTGWVSNKYLTTKKPVAKKAPAKKPAVKNLAEGLKTVDKNNQLILVTSNGYNTTSATIQTFERDSKGKWVQVLSTKGHIGKNGFGINSKEGDGQTPVGKYTIGTGFGQKGNPGTKMPFKNITSDDIWVDDSKSSYYNSWQSKKKVKGKYTSAENMNHRLYTYGFVINFNTKRVPYEGSAIFFHVGNSYTLGCVATSEANVKSIMKWMDPAKKPVIIQTPTQDLSKY